MRALAAYLTVILCCGFYKDKQLPAYLSLKSSSISAFCKIFSAKNPYPITVRTEKRQNKADRKRFLWMRFPAAGTLRQRPDSLFRPPAIRTLAGFIPRSRTHAKVSTLAMKLFSVSMPASEHRRGYITREWWLWTDPAGPMLCSNVCDPARDARCLRTKSGGPIAVDRTDRSRQINCGDLIFSMSDNI